MLQKPKFPPRANAPAAFACLMLLALSLPSLSAPPPADSQKNWQPDSQQNPQFDYAIITQLTDAGRALPAPAYDKPVYYIANFPSYSSKEQRDNDDASSSAKPIPNSPSPLQKALTTAFAANGYRPADAEHPATQVLFIESGTCDKIELSGAAANDTSEDSGDDKAANPGFQENLVARAKLLGGQKFAGEFAQALNENGMEHFSTRDETTKALVYLIYNDCFYLRVSSLDVEALKKNQKKLLWTTTISTPSQGLSLEMSLPLMINTASYYYGRKTKGIEIVRRLTGRRATLAPATSPAIAPTATTQVSPSARQLASANNAFACDLYTQLKSAGGNLFFSPFSVSSALAMACAGAKGDTAEQMRKTLRFPVSPADTHAGFAELLKHFDEVQRSGNAQLNIANSLWPQMDAEAPLLESYLALVKQNYGAEITPLDFKHAESMARARINQWVKEKTRNKITNLFARPLTSETRLVLVNAVYFKGIWERKFNPQKTTEAPFFTADDRSVQTPFMQQTADFNLAATSHCWIIELPYQGGALSMFVVLPRDKSPAGLAALETDLTEKQIAAWKSPMTPAKLEIYFPKFKLEWGATSLTGALTKLGMRDAFVFGSADFSGMNGNRDFAISDVLQKAFVSVDEDGSEAAAATGGVVAITGAEPIFTYRIDHPFLFFIQDNATGSILFMGRVMNPTAQ